MNATNDWKRWLNEHPTAKTYDAHPDRIKGMLGNNGEKNFESLTKMKNLVLLSKAQMGGKIQASFYHSTVGIPIVPELCHHTARIGMLTGSGIEIDPQSLFKSSKAILKPDLLNLMKVKMADKFQNLGGDSNKQSKKVKCFALLTPSIAEAIQPTDMSPTEIFLKTVEKFVRGFNKEKKQTQMRSSRTSVPLSNRYYCSCGRATMPQTRSQAPK